MAGKGGEVKLLFKQQPDPGKLLEAERMDFRERDAVPQAAAGDLLARRSLPCPGRPGTDVRGKVLKPPKNERDLLYAGQNVVAEEKGEEQVYYATASGWARVLKDTLSVMQRLRQRGDLDYRVGNLKIEGDVELEGTVRSRFVIEATGDVYVGGTVEGNAQIVAGGNVIVQRGIVGAKVKAEGDLHARFIQDSEVNVGGDLVVRNYIRDSEVQVQGKATIQGNEGGDRHLCLLGGTLLARAGVDAASIGSVYGRETSVMAGIDLAIEKHLERYRKGLAFADLRSRRASRALESAVGGMNGKGKLAEAIGRASGGRRDFAIRRMKELEALQKLKVSLEHHLEGMTVERSEIAGRARVRVTGKAFEKVTIQIGEASRLLDEEMRAAVFHLNEGHTQIGQSLL